MSCQPSPNKDLFLKTVCRKFDVQMTLVRKICKSDHHTRKFFIVGWLNGKSKSWHKMFMPLFRSHPLHNQPVHSRLELCYSEDEDFVEHCKIIYLRSTAVKICSWCDFGCPWLKGLLIYMADLSMMNYMLSSQIYLNKILISSHQLEKEWRVHETELDSLVLSTRLTRHA